MVRVGRSPNYCGFQHLCNTAGKHSNHSYSLFTHEHVTLVQLDAGLCQSTESEQRVHPLCFQHS